MAIIDGIKQIKQFATGTNGDKQLISNWTSTSTVYDWDEIERKWVDVHDTLASVNKVAQIPTDNTRTYYELLFSESNDNLEHTEGTRKSQYLIYNPDIKRLKIGEEQTSSDISNTSITDHFIRTGTDTDYITLTSDDLTLTGDTWDGSHRSLKDTISYFNTIILQIAIDSVSGTNQWSRTISSSDLNTIAGISDITDYMVEGILWRPYESDQWNNSFQFDSSSNRIYPACQINVNNNKDLRVQVYDTTSTADGIVARILLKKINTSNIKSFPSS